MPVTFFLIDFLLVFYFEQHFYFQFNEQCQFFPLISSWFNQSFNSYEKLPATTAYQTWQVLALGRLTIQYKKTRHFFSNKFRDSIWLNYNTRIQYLKTNTNRGRCWSINSHIVVSQQVIKIISPITQQKAFHNFHVTNSKRRELNNNNKRLKRNKPNVLTTYSFSPSTSTYSSLAEAQQKIKSKSSKSKTRHYIIEYY